MKSVNFHSCLEVNNKIWFLSVEGYLMNLDCTTFESKIVFPFNMQQWYFKQVINDMIALNNKIYFVEQEGSRIYEYDIQSNYCNFYSISNVMPVNGACFSGIHLYCDEIYLFSRLSDTVFCFHTINKTFRSIVGNLKIITTHSIRVENKVYLYGEKIVCFDMVRNQFLYDCNPGEDYIFWMQEFQNQLYILTKNKISIWDEMSNESKIVYDMNGDIGELGIFFITRNKIFLLLNLIKDILVIDRQSGTISNDVPPADLFYIEKGWSKYWGYTQNEKYIWVANRSSNQIICIDKKTETIKWNKLKNPKEREKIPYINLIENMLLDEKEFSIEEYILFCGKKFEIDNDNKIFGKKIWDMIR